MQIFQLHHEIFKQKPLESSKSNTCQMYNSSFTYDICILKTLKDIFEHDVGCGVPYMNLTVPVCKQNHLVNKVFTNN